MNRALDEPATIAAAANQISELIRIIDLTTPIGHLGRWRVSDVVAHLGGVHRWTTRIVNSRSMKGPRFTKSKLDGVELCDWFDTGVQELLNGFQNNDRNETCPNFNPGSVKTVGWWSRRQMHETTIHRWDIERSVDRATPIGPIQATDGIDEFLDVFVRARGKQTLTGPLLLTTTQPSQTWTLTPAQKPGRIDIAGGESGQFAAKLSGSPNQLLLALWGRLALAETEITITGDKTVGLSLIQSAA